MVAWNDERVEKLKNLWGKGLSATKVAMMIGGFEHTKDRGRCSVLGKISRLGLSDRRGKRTTKMGLSYSGNRKTRAQVKSERKHTDLKFNGAPWIGNAGPKSQAPLFAKEPLPLEEPVPDALFSLLDWADTGCMWPYGGVHAPVMYGCSCERVPTKSYCESHLAKSMRKYVLPRLTWPADGQEQMAGYHNSQNISMPLRRETEDA
jgi:GcrA cell cycle regulator